MVKYGQVRSSTAKYGQVRPLIAFILASKSKCHFSFISHMESQLLLSNKLKTHKHTIISSLYGSYLDDKDGRWHEKNTLSLNCS